MAEYLSPGVYVEEYESGPRAIEGVGTSTAGFVGLAEKGPTSGAPQFVSNFGEFTRIFGGFLTEYSFGDYRFLANSVEQFFVNGGTRCYVSRVIPKGAACAAKTVGGLSVKAANEGKWGNRIQVFFNTAKRRKIQIIAKNADGSYVIKNPEGLYEGDTLEFAGEYNRVKTLVDQNVTFENEFKGDIVDAGLVAKRFLLLVTADVTVKYNDTVEKFTDVSFNITSPDYIGSRMERSTLVEVAYDFDAKAGNPVEGIFGEGQANGFLTLEGGNDGKVSAINAETFIGKDNGPGKRTGIQSFIENNVVSMIAVPGVTIPEVVVSLVGHCENQKNRVAVLDMPRNASALNDLTEYRGMIDSTYAAMYHPWIQVLDRSAGKAGFVPPSGAVMGVYSRTDMTRGVHKAPANETVFATGLSVNYTKNEQDMLNPEGINLIRAIPGQGIRIWGARTASSNSTFRYINVRRLFIFVEESIKANTNWVVFEPNDQTLWARLQITITSFLDGLYRGGMLAGSTPGEAYFVEIGPTTMTKDDVDNGRLICNIGIAPSKPAEFVIFRITQNTAGAGGEAEGGEE